MAVIGRRSFFFAALLLPAVAVPVAADESADIRRALSDVASALSVSNAEQAMEPFDKDAFDGYDKLSSFFQGLTGAYQVDSQIDVTSEDSTETSATLEVHWVLTLTDPATNLDQRRTGDITVKLAKKKNSWRIVGFTPIGLFDPQMAR
jgi:hypothetical protein